MSLVDDVLKTPCGHGLCTDHDACCQTNPHVDDHVHCMWCRHCRTCHPHECYHLGDPCQRCGTLIADREKPTFGEYAGMCQPPA